MVSVAVTASPTRSGRCQVNRWSVCTVRLNDNSNSGSSNIAPHAAELSTTAKVGGAIACGPWYAGFVASPSAAANSATLAALTT